MVDTPKTESDFENLSDEDFMKLDETNFAGNAPEGQSLLNTPTPEEEDNADTQNPDTSSDAGESAESNSGDISASEPEASEEKKAAETSEESEETGEIFSKDANAQEGEQSVAKPEGEEQKTPDPDADSDTKKSEVTQDKEPKGFYKLPEGMDSATLDGAVAFFKQVTAPFKADGKDFEVRSPEDAIRLMQQGVNYSRRMQEIKPMKRLARVLTDNNLDDTDKLNFLVDVSKGDREAIIRLLKDHKIDPMDLDLEKESGYQAHNYSGSAEDHSFRDALDETVTTPDGQALVAHIHADWDDASKAKLRENPVILGNLSNLKQAGVYDKVVNELRYQQGMGYLVDVPFLQAFDQVGEAMKKAGVFDTQNTPAARENSMGSLQAQPQNTPVASGARKSDQAKEQTNPHLSSAPPTKSAQTAETPEQDFGKLSDEDFLKMAPPP